MVFSVFHTNDLTRNGGSVFLRFLEPVSDSSELLKELYRRRETAQHKCEACCGRDVGLRRAQSSRFAESGYDRPSFRDISQQAHWFQQLRVLCSNGIPIAAKLAVECPVYKAAIPLINELEWFSFRGEVDVISACPHGHSQL
jgi:hypothetical protein